MSSTSAQDADAATFAPLFAYPERQTALHILGINGHEAAHLPVVGQKPCRAGEESPKALTGDKVEHHISWMYLVRKAVRCMENTTICFRPKQAICVRLDKCWRESADSPLTSASMSETWVYIAAERPEGPLKSLATPSISCRNWSCSYYRPA